ncbi:MAG: hypothetical protein L7F77_16105 [Candidatus Magnetominusculus sp. LBB02]|nr:hypothetical protein [Candidatus Magnetominusculus sp. LBB02]
MKLLFTDKAIKDYDSLEGKLQVLVDKQLDALLRDIRYPSLRAKKYSESHDIWQIRINREYRAYFSIDGNTYVIMTICRHPK